MIGVYMQTKKEIRKELLLRRDALNEKEQLRAEILITERILGHQWFYRSDIILGFMSYGSEIRTGQLLEEALRKGKRVYLPRVEGEEMNFYRIEGASGDLEKTDNFGLVSGYHGIPEPSGHTERYRYYEEDALKSLILMPGVGFDPYRNRLGYGKGFYDRFLADKPGLQIRSIAIGHQCQMVESLPADERDIRPYQVILV